jgi:hypothetical protein
LLCRRCMAAAVLCCGSMMTTSEPANRAGTCWCLPVSLKSERKVDLTVDRKRFRRLDRPSELYFARNWLIHRWRALTAASQNAAYSASMSSDKKSELGDQKGSAPARSTCQSTHVLSCAVAPFF